MHAYFCTAQRQHWRRETGNRSGSEQCWEGQRSPRPAHCNTAATRTNTRGKPHRRTRHTAVLHRRCPAVSCTRIASHLHSQYATRRSALKCAHKTSQHARPHRNNTGTHARARARAQEPRPYTGLAGQAVANTRTGQTNAHITHRRGAVGVRTSKRHAGTPAHTRTHKYVRGQGPTHLNSARGCQRHEHNTLLLCTQAAPLAPKSQPHCCRHP